jgi:hypothetical protein
MKRSCENDLDLQFKRCKISSTSEEPNSEEPNSGGINSEEFEESNSDAIIELIHSGLASESFLRDLLMYRYKSFDTPQICEFKSKMRSSKLSAQAQIELFRLVLNIETEFKIKNEF